VIVYRRPGLAGGAASFTISIDQKQISKLGNGRYITIPINAGEHIVEAKFNGLQIGPSRQAIGVSVKPNETVYINVGVGMWTNNDLERVDPLQGRADVSVLKPQK
jgi:hypothetical protein